jgi:hypothetical protein
MNKLFLVFLITICSQVLKAQLTYNGVAGVFYTRCATCHNSNGMAPFPLTSFDETAPYVSSIANALQNNRMPPWLPDTLYSRHTNEKIITQSEKNAILNWITNGYPQGDTTLAPPAPVFGAYKLNGTPDLIIKIPSFAINSTSTQDAYDIFAIPMNLPSDKIVKAIEVVPNKRQAVHHIVVTADTTGTMVSDLSGNAYGSVGQIGLSGSLAQPVIYPNAPPLKTGVHLPNQSQLIVQMHYSEGFAGLVDSTEFRFYFYPDGEPNIREMYIMIPLQNWYFWINAEETKTIVVDTALYDNFDISLFSALPHSHRICTKVVNYAYNPSGDTIPLLRINNWDFHWQDYYFYKNLVKIPIGYRYHGIHEFANTSTNPNNPFNPPQWIPVGLNSNDEMFFDAFQFMVYYPGDENINVDSIIHNDPLWVTSTHELPLLNKYSYSFAYPNPAENAVTLQMVGSLELEKNAILKIVDELGKSVNPKITKSSNSYEINLSGLKAGIYFYQIRSGDKIISNGKFMKIE